VWQTDRQTDGRTIAYSALSIMIRPMLSLCCRVLKMVIKLLLHIAEMSTAVKTRPIADLHNNWKSVYFFCFQTPPRRWSYDGQIWHADAWRPCTGLLLFFYVYRGSSLRQQESPADADKPARLKRMQKLLQFGVFRFISPNSISPNFKLPMHSFTRYVQSLGLYIVIHSLKSGVCQL